MRGNDLANVVVPRDVLVFEGLLGLLPDVRTRAVEAKFRKRGKWKQAVACYEINELLARKVWDLTWRFSFEVDLLTYLGYEFAEALAARMDREAMPFHRVYHEKPELLARTLAIQPDIRNVYDPDPGHQFSFGSKGRIIQPHDAHLLFGAM
jgi:hypothetical protein